MPSSSFWVLALRCPAAECCKAATGSSGVERPSSVNVNGARAPHKCPPAGTRIRGNGVFLDVAVGRTIGQVPGFEDLLQAHQQVVQPHRISSTSGDVGDVGADEIGPVQINFPCNADRIAHSGQGGNGDAQGEVLGHIVFARVFPPLTPLFPTSLSSPATTAFWMVFNRSSVAFRSSSRWCLSFTARVRL